MNLRSTLLTLAAWGTRCPRRRSPNCSRCGPDRATPSSWWPLLGLTAPIGDGDTVQGKWAEYLLASRATTIYGGTSEVQLNIIAERLLGLPRDP